MFKLVKTINSRSNVPEPCLLTASLGSEYKIGTLIAMNEGFMHHCDATERPTHMIAENAPRSHTGKITCYPVTGDMIFETHFTEEPVYIGEGSRVTLGRSIGVPVGVTAVTEGGVAEVYNLMGASVANDKVLIRFPD